MKDELSITPVQLQEHTCKHSKHAIVPELPPWGITLAPSGSDKTVLLPNIISNVYLDCFERLCIFSPSVHVGQTWQAVKDDQERLMKVK